MPLSCHVTAHSTMCFLPLFEPVSAFWICLNYCNVSLFKLSSETIIAQKSHICVLFFRVIYNTCTYSIVKINVFSPFSIQKIASSFICIYTSNFLFTAIVHLLSRCDHITIGFDSNRWVTDKCCLLVVNRSESVTHAFSPERHYWHDQPGIISWCHELFPNFMWSVTCWQIFGFLLKVSYLAIYLYQYYHCHC